MSQHESPRTKFEREITERQRLVDLAYSVSPPPADGMKRLMWFGDSDTPMPVDVPESVAAQIEALSAKARFDPQPLNGFPMPDQRKAMSEIRRLVQPYIDAKYPTLEKSQAKNQSETWWNRILRKFGLGK